MIDTGRLHPVLPNLVFTGGPNDATIWSVTPEGQLTSPQVLSGSDTSSGIESAAFSPDGLNLAVGYEDGTVRIVDPTTASVTASIVPAGETEQPRSPIASVTFGGADDTVYAGDADDSSSGNGNGNVYEIKMAGSAEKVSLLPTGQYGSIASLSYTKPPVGSPVLLIGTSEGLEAYEPGHRPAGRTLPAGRGHRPGDLYQNQRPDLRGRYDQGCHDHPELEPQHQRTAGAWCRRNRP